MRTFLTPAQMQGLGREGEREGGKERGERERRNVASRYLLIPKNKLRTRPWDFQAVARAHGQSNYARGSKRPPLVIQDRVFLGGKKFPNHTTLWLSLSASRARSWLSISSLSFPSALRGQGSSRDPPQPRAGQRVPSASRLSQRSRLRSPPGPGLTVGKALPWLLGPLPSRPVQGAFEHAAPSRLQLSLLQPPPPPAPAQGPDTVRSNQPRVR